MRAATSFCEARTLNPPSRPLVVLGEDSLTPALAWLEPPRRARRRAESSPPKATNRPSYSVVSGLSVSENRSTVADGMVGNFIIKR